MKAKALAPTKEKVTKLHEPDSEQFRMICHDMYVRFGACYKTLSVLCKEDKDKYLLSDELHKLRTAMRDLLQEAKDAK
jgi:hypothetical protein